MVTYSGDSNSLTGQGSPNPIKLTLPMLDQVQDPAVQASLLRIQQFINNLVAPSSAGGAYDSLTGPGETATPGDLTQAGGFTVNAPSGSTTGINFNAPNGHVQIESLNTSPSPASLGQIYVQSGASAASGQITMQASGTTTIQAGTGVSGTTNGHIHLAAQTIKIDGFADLYLGPATGAGNIYIACNQLTFFGGTSLAPLQSVSGSRGGNAALAALLGSLAAYNLIIDYTTP